MRVLITSLSMLLPTAALAFEPVTDRGTFLAIVTGKQLTGEDTALIVSDGGAITGRTGGVDVTGDWTWEGEYFCRTLESARRAFPLDCQTVGVQGDVVRFRADRGTGDALDLTLR